MQNVTELGMNRSGIVVAEDGGEKMMENTTLTKPSRGDETLIGKIRAEYAMVADPVGTLPEPRQDGMSALLMDKLGERLAFERAGTRLYDALLVKVKAEKSAGIPVKEVQHIREEEAMHFALVGAAIQALGGDPTAQTPSADVAGVEGMGLMQVLTDPKTTLAQALHAILIAEMTDNAAWPELIELVKETSTGQAGSEDLVGRFTRALENEQEHLEKVQEWYRIATVKAFDL